MRKRFCSLVLNCSLIALLPGIAAAAGTYYTGNYNSPQRNYATSGYANRAKTTNYSQDTSYTRTRTVAPNDNAYIGQPYNGYTRVVGTEQQTRTQMRTTGGNTVSSGGNVQKENGFWLGAGLSHEFASWNFDMKSAGSKLHYDNIRWNVLDINAGYRFGGNTRMQIDAGFRYGMQFGDSPMVDDDISNGGYFVTDWYNDKNHNHVYDTGDEYIGQELGHSLSIGNSSSGDMMGFNVGFGLTDFMKLGHARITPSVGFRYLKYKLDTKDDYGLTVNTGSSSIVSGSDETQYDPIVIVHFPPDSQNPNGMQQVLWCDPSNPNETCPNAYGFWPIVVGADGVSTSGTYMFKLPSISHSYETTWMGPYLALDLDYEIDRYNLVNARLEFGLPLYTSTGDQPYRTDWQHPKSVEDKGSFGDAWHIGLGANYMTALTDTVALTLGFTFDYYTLSGGEASTYLNSSYYMGIYNEIKAEWLDAGYTENDMIYGRTQSGKPASQATSTDPVVVYPDPTAVNIIDTKNECPGWVCKVDNEIESVYKSIGIRIGIQAKF